MRVTEFIIMSVCFILIGVVSSSCRVDSDIDQDVSARVEIYYPNCAQIEDDILMIECIKAASELKIGVGEEEVELLKELGVDLSDEEQEV